MGDVFPGDSPSGISARLRTPPYTSLHAPTEQGPFSTWVEYETAATMLHHLLMGFELELYEPREYDMIVW